MNRVDRWAFTALSVIMLLFHVGHFDTRDRVEKLEPVAGCTVCGGECLSHYERGKGHYIAPEVSDDMRAELLRMWEGKL